MHHLYIYAPNIPKDRLAEWAAPQLADAGIEVAFYVPERKGGFRSPQLGAVLPSDGIDILVPVLETILIGARGLGGSQFLIKNSGFDMRRRSTAIASEELERLLIACQGYVFEQIEIY